MTALKERMIEDLQVHGFAEKTQEAYLRAVRQLATYYKNHRTGSQGMSFASISST